MDDFIETREEDSRRFLTTKKLPTVVDAWIQIHRHTTDDVTNNQHLEHLIACIMTARRLLMAVRRATNLTGSILWSTASIAETMESIVLETLHKGTRSLPTQWQACFNTYETQVRLLDNGWCQTDIIKWRASSGGFQNLLYLSKLKQPVRKDHSNCTGSACVAHQYDMSNQTAIHRCATGSCGMLHVDIRALKAAFDDGYMDLLDIQGEDPSTMTVGVVSSKNSEEYVALSHVWADGLGNPAAKCLPRCQLHYVGKIVRHLGKASGNPQLLL